MRTEREREKQKKKSEVIGLHASEVQKRKKEFKKRIGFERVSDHLIARQRPLKFHCSLVSVCVSGYITTVDKDKFLVMAMEVTGDTYDTSLWKTAPKDTIMEHRFVIMFLLSVHLDNYCSPQATCNTSSV